MTNTLTIQEINIIEKFIANNYNEFSEIVFNHAMSHTLPSWRSESLYNNNAYLTYINTINTGNNHGHQNIQ